MSFCLERGAESSESQRRGGPFIQDGRFVGKAESERRQTLEVAEEDFALLRVQEQRAGLVVGLELGVLSKQGRQVALQQTVVEREPQPRPTSAHIGAHKADFLQLRDDITAGETRKRHSLLSNMNNSYETRADK